MKSSAQRSFRRIAILGVGLIGGSLALAIKRRFPAAYIAGYDKPAVLKRAKERRAIDEAAASPHAAVDGADLVVLAAPISAILSLLPKLSASVAPGTIVTDVGSVKQSIAALGDMFFPNGNFIGGHPMTGAEFSGIEAAHPLLFQNAVYLLTPTENTDRRLLACLANFLDDMETRVMKLSPEEHDSTVAALSHMPQLAAVALMNTVGSEQCIASKRLTLGAGGFRDMTRIASSPFGMWRDILAANQEAAAAILRQYIEHLKHMADVLEKHPERLESEFRTSRTLRSRIPRSMKGFLTPLVDVSVFVEDKPGQLALLAGVLSKAKINIKDLELLKVREHRGGTFRLSLESRRVAEKAKRVLRRAGFEVGS
jgi:prephenate dehydrogenase